MLDASGLALLLALLLGLLLLANLLKMLFSITGLVSTRCILAFLLIVSGSSSSILTLAFLLSSIFLRLLLDDDIVRLALNGLDVTETSHSAGNPALIVSGIDFCALDLVGTSR